MKMFIYVVAGIFCLGSIKAADPNEAEPVQASKKEKENAGAGPARKGAPRNPGKLVVGVDDVHAAKTGGDSHGRIVTGNDQGVWLFGKNNQKHPKKQAQADDKRVRGKKTSQPIGPIKTQQVTSSPQQLKTSAAVTTSAKPTPSVAAQTQTTTTIQTTTAVGGSQSSGSVQPTIPLGGQTGAPAN